MSVTLKEIKAQALDLSDSQEGSFIDDARLTDYVNLALSELYDILVDSYQDYFSTVYTITTTANTETYDLPKDFYKALKVFSLSGGNRYRLSRFTLDDLDQYQDDLVVINSENSNCRYRILGNKIYFSPKTLTGNVELWYIPQVTKLKKDGDSIPIQIPCGWEEFLIASVCVKIAVKKESDTSGFAMIKEQARQRIISSASNRDAGESHRITDKGYRFVNTRSY